ncbi:MAG: type II toxin-antitoxin system RelE/ParE family toxin, partial [Chloroflexi bacterium]|nr:type II toxin-antitoxin system RelE/ParE family toxin [Chloroflexota bacterium]
NLRQHLKRIIEGLADEPRPPRSKALDTGGLNVPSEVELRRLRIERWRVVYALNESEGWIWVLAVRHRPPYDYEDIKELILRLE